MKRRFPRETDQEPVPQTEISQEDSQDAASDMVGLVEKIGGVMDFIKGMGQELAGENADEDLVIDATIAAWQAVPRAHRPSAEELGKEFGLHRTSIFRRAAKPHVPGLRRRAQRTWFGDEIAAMIQGMVKAAKAGSAPAFRAAMESLGEMEAENHVTNLVIDSAALNARIDKLMSLGDEK